MSRPRLLVVDSDPVRLMLLADRLRDALSTLAADPARRLAMAEAARGLAMPDAAARVADAVLAVARFDAAQHKEAA